MDKIEINYYQLFKIISSSKEELDRFIESQGLLPLAPMDKQPVSLEELAFEYTIAQRDIILGHNTDDA